MKQDIKKFILIWKNFVKMKEYFDKDIIRQAEFHAKKHYPKEACGFLMKDRFMPVENVAEDKVNDFKINQKEFFRYKKDTLAIIHSHADYPHLSKADMDSQIRSALPWGIILLKKGSVEHTFFWGDQLPVQDLIERPFCHGLYDCYSLVRDYYRTKEIIIPPFTRDNLWWEKDPSMLENGMEEAGFHFIDVSEMKVGDVIFMKIMADVVNHSAVYIGNGLILHHLYNRLSRREPLNRWRKYVTGYLRYKHAT